MSQPELPDDPVVAWSESRCPWWSFGLLPLIFDAIDRPRALSISKNGIRADNRFLRWDEIDEVVAADDPDLASIRLTNGDVVRLDRWHLPLIGTTRAKSQRLDLLRRALDAGRTRR